MLSASTTKWTYKIQQLAISTEPESAPLKKQDNTISDFEIQNQFGVKIKDPTRNDPIAPLPDVQKYNTQTELSSPNPIDYDHAFNPKHQFAYSL